MELLEIVPYLPSLIFGICANHSVKVASAESQLIISQDSTKKNIGPQGTKALVLVSAKKSCFTRPRGHRWKTYQSSGEQYSTGL